MPTIAAPSTPECPRCPRPDQYAIGPSQFACPAFAFRKIAATYPAAPSARALRIVRREYRPPASAPARVEHAQANLRLRSLRDSLQQRAEPALPPRARKNPRAGKLAALRFHLEKPSHSDQSRLFLSQPILPVACSYDLSIAMTKYFDALDDGEAPTAARLCFERFRERVSFWLRMTRSFVGFDFRSLKIFFCSGGY